MGNYKWLNARAPLNGGEIFRDNNKEVDTAYTGLTIGDSKIDKASKKASVSFSRPFLVNANNGLDLTADTSYALYCSAGVYDNNNGD